MKTNKIVIADPSMIVSKGLAFLLRDLPDYDVVLHSTELSSIAGRLRMLRPAILILNPLMIDFSKRRMIRSLFEDLPDMKLVALTSSFCEEQILRQFNAVIEITDDFQRIKSVLKQVIVQQNNQETDTDSSMLSNRERDVLVYMAKGKKNSEIADCLNLSVHTVITHRKNIVRKTGIKSVAALTVYAILNNLIDEKDIL